MRSVDTRTLHSKIENIKALPTIPDTMRRLTVLFEKKATTLDEVSRFVWNDPALTVKVLRMINSAIYGFPGRISSVNHAIMLLGLNVVKGLLLGVSVIEMMQKSMVGLWEHSLCCSLAARNIATRKGIKEPDEVAVAALLHDIGKVILITEYPHEYEAAIKDCEQKEIIIAEAEITYFAEPHSSIGRILFEKWHFPANLVECIAYHHIPELAKLAPMETAIVHFADILVRARGLGFAGDAFLPKISNSSLDMLNLSDNDIKDVLREIETYGSDTEGLDIS